MLENIYNSVTQAVGFTEENVRFTTKLSSFSKTAAVAAVVFAASSINAKASSLYQVTVDTSTLNATAGNIDFQFNPGGGTTQPAFVTISSFTGATVNGTASTINGVSGNLPATVTINNSGGSLNDYFQALTFGPSLSFLLQFSGPAVDSPNGTATSGSSFGLSLFNSAGDTALLTNNADGFIGTADVNLDGTVTTTTFPSNNEGGSPVATFALTSVPEPSTFVLFGASFLLFGYLSRGFVQSRRNS